MSTTIVLLSFSAEAGKAGFQPTLHAINVIDINLHKYWYKHFNKLN